MGGAGVGAHGAGERQAVHAGHFDVGDQHLRRLLGDDGQRRLPVFRQRHAELVRRQQPAGLDAHHLGVIDHHHQGLGCAAGRTGGCRRWRGRGQRRIGRGLGLRGHAGGGFGGALLLQRLGSGGLPLGFGAFGLDAFGFDAGRLQAGRCLALSLLPRGLGALGGLSFGEQALLVEAGLLKPRLFDAFGLQPRLFSARGGLGLTGGFLASGRFGIGGVLLGLQAFELGLQLGLQCAGRFGLTLGLQPGGGLALQLALMCFLAQGLLTRRFVGGQALAFGFGGRRALGFLAGFALGLQPGCGGALRVLAVDGGLFLGGAGG